MGSTCLAHGHLAARVPSGGFGTDPNQRTQATEEVREQRQRSSGRARTGGCHSVPRIQSSWPINRASSVTRHATSSCTAAPQTKGAACDIRPMRRGTCRGGGGGIRALLSDTGPTRPPSDPPTHPPTNILRGRGGGSLVQCLTELCHRGCATAAWERTQRACHHRLSPLVLLIYYFSFCSEFV